MLISQSQRENDTTPQYEDIFSNPVPVTPTPQPKTSKKVTNNKKNSLLFRKRISVGRAISYLVSGLFLYLEIRLWETNHSLLWEWTKEQAILWIGLAIGFGVALGILIGFKGLRKWAVSPRKIILMLITLFVIYQMIIAIPHWDVVWEWMTSTFLPTPITGWMVSLFSILFAFLKMPTRRKKK